MFEALSMEDETQRKKNYFFQQGKREDFSYDYWKTIELSPKLPELIVRYLFVNSGKKRFPGCSMRIILLRLMMKFLRGHI